MLTVILPQEQVDRLMALAEDSPGAEIEVDLPSQTVTSASGAPVRFDIDAYVKRSLVEGLDEISLALQHERDIAAYEAKRPAFLPETAR